MCIYMVEMRINRDVKNRTSVNLPSFIRDKFGLLDGDRVTIDTDGDRIIIIPKSSNDKVIA